ncbi:MAG: DUF3253 domain-containing protein [Pseudomonadota bacterium]
MSQADACWDDAAFEQAILDLLAARRPGATICPSEAARRLDPVAWRDLMTPVRAAAGRLEAARRIVGLQKGHAVDLATARGPIRLSLVPQAGAKAEG